MRQLEVANQIRDKTDDTGDGPQKKPAGRGGNKTYKKPSGARKWYNKQGQSTSSAADPPKTMKKRNSESCKKSKEIAVTPSPMKSLPGSPAAKVTKPKSKAKAKAKAKMTSPAKRKSAKTATPSKDKPGGKKKTEDSKERKRKAKASAEPSKASQPRAEKEKKATFARRAAPKSDPSLTFWRLVRLAFEEVIEPCVKSPSSLEDPITLQVWNWICQFPKSRFPKTLDVIHWALHCQGVSLPHEDPFWKFANNEFKANGDYGNLGEAARKWASDFLAEPSVTSRFLFYVTNHALNEKSWQHMRPHDGLSKLALLTQESSSILEKILLAMVIEWTGSL